MAQYCVGSQYGAPLTSSQYVTSTIGVPVAGGSVGSYGGEENAAEGTPLSAALCARLGVPVGTLWGLPAGQKRPDEVTSSPISLKQFPDIEDADKVICAKRAPIPKDLKKGETVYWCTCGRSKNQPFCDGSHSGTKFTPLPYTATEDGPKYFCQCKQTGKAPLCDGAHTKIPEDKVGKPLPAIPKA